MATALPERSHPAIPYELQIGDFGYDKGRRFKLEQQDGECFTFRTRPELDAFAAAHGYVFVVPEQMESIRLDCKSTDKK